MEHTEQEIKAFGDKLAELMMQDVIRMTIDPHELDEDTAEFIYKETMKALSRNEVSRDADNV